MACMGLPGAETLSASLCARYTALARESNFIAGSLVNRYNELIK
jgi:hypothetical protein